MAAAARSLSWRTCGSRSPTMRRVGACTRARASPAKSGRPPREMTSRTRSGRSAAVINAAAAPVLAPKTAKGSWAVSFCWAKPIRRPGQPLREPGNVEAQFARTQVDLLLLRRQQVQQQSRPAALLKDARHASDSVDYDGYCHFRGQKAQHRGGSATGRARSPSSRRRRSVLEPFVRQPCRCSCPQSGPCAS